MTPHDLLLGYALLGIPAGLLVGMAMGLVARREDGWGGYGSFRRRAARLGHVAAVMLPLLAGFYALALAEEVASGLWWGAGLFVAGGIGLPLALFAAAWKPRLALALPVPATAVLAGAAAFALAHLAS